jgi:hypothetical protein
MPIDDFSSLSNLEVTKELLEIGGLTRDSFKDAFSSRSIKEAKSELSKLGCFGDCKKNYKRGEGRGVCRAECWFNILIKVIPIIIATVK